VELAGDTTIKLIEQFGKGNLDLILQTDNVLGANVQNIALCDFPMRWVGATSLNLHGELLTLADLANFPVLSFSRNSGPHRFLERLLDEQVGRRVHVNCMTSVSAMVRLVVDGFGLAMIPPAIIQRELANGDVQMLKLDMEMPDMPLVCSYRAGPETPLFQQIAAQAQQTAQDFARSLPAHVARLPSATAVPDPWSPISASS
jgi:DNA-binding transcriptional LysR family regulator